MGNVLFTAPEKVGPGGQSLKIRWTKFLRGSRLFAEHQTICIPRVKSLEERVQSQGQAARDRNLLLFRGV